MFDAVLKYYKSKKVKDILLIQDILDLCDIKLDSLQKFEVDLGAVTAVLRLRKQRILTEDQMLKAWLQLD